MLKKAFIALVSIIIVIFSMSIIKIDDIRDNNIKKDVITDSKTDKPEEKNSKKNTDKNDIIGYIMIDKLNINRPLYNIDSPNNNIEENITILKESTMPTNDNSIMFIAAHSGTGYIAFFKDLNKLKKGDEVKLIYNNKEYIYIVQKTWEDKKNGYINVNKTDNKQLVLTTCSPNKDNYQLIVNCILKS